MNLVAFLYLLAHSGEGGDVRSNKLMKKIQNEYSLAHLLPPST